MEVAYSGSTVSHRITFARTLLFTTIQWK